MFSNHDVARYYDLSEVHYRLFWQLEKSRSLHYGYWDASTRNFHEALLNTNRVLAVKAGLKKGHTVLDAGCGVGGSSLWLAQALGCTVTGISLSEKQIKKARHFAQQAGLEGQVSFEKQDFTQTGFPDASFDAVWCIESVCHAGDKAVFLREAFRLLKKGGCLILADFFKKDGLNGVAAQQVQAFAHSWAVPAFSTWEAFLHQLQQTGFHHIETNNVSKAVWPSVRRLYRAYLLGKPAALLYRLFRGKPTVLAGNNVESARLQYQTFQKGWWQYRIVKAVKE